MGWGLLVGSRLHSWHNTGQKLLLLGKIPKTVRTATMGCGCKPLICPGLWLTSALSQLQQLLVIFALPLSSTRLSLCKEEELPVQQWQWAWQVWGAQPWEGTDCAVTVCYLGTPRGEKQHRDLAGAQPDSSSEQVGRCCFVLLLGAPGSAKPSCSPSEVLGNGHLHYWESIGSL